MIVPTKEMWDNEITCVSAESTKPSGLVVFPAEQGVNGFPRILLLPSCFAYIEQT
jgi:hypothetical protein